MKITYKGDYALKALLDLSEHYAGGGVVPLAEIAGRQDIPTKYLEQIMLVLTGAGHVRSHRGVGGGFALQKAPEDITLGEIVRLIEGPIEIIACVARGGADDCRDSGCCAFQEIWEKVSEATASIIDSVTFSQMMRRTRELRESQSDPMYHI